MANQLQITQNNGTKNQINLPLSVIANSSNNYQSTAIKPTVPSSYIYFNQSSKHSALNSHHVQPHINNKSNQPKNAAVQNGVPFGIINVKSENKQTRKRSYDKVLIH